MKLDQPLEVSTPQLTVTQTDKSGTRTLLKDEKFHVSLAGTVSVPQDAMSARLSKLLVESSSGLVTLAKAGDQDFVGGAEVGAPVDVERAVGERRLHQRARCQHHDRLQRLEGG